MTTSTYLKNKLLNHVFRGTTYTAPSAVYIGLYTGTNITTASPIGDEISGGNYARVGLIGGFSTAASGITVNSGSIIFNTPTTNWGTVAYMGISNQATTGSLLFYGEITAPKNVTTGETVKINEGNLSINLGDNFTDYSFVDGEGPIGPPIYDYRYGWSNYLATELLDHVLNNNAYGTPNVFLALYNIVPSANDLYGIETSASGYARVQVGGSGSWVSSTSGSTYNIQPIIFVETAIVSWSNIQGIGFRDANPGGNLLFTGLFKNGITVGIGDGFKFNANTLKITLDDSANSRGGNVLL